MYFITIGNNGMFFVVINNILQKSHENLRQENKIEN